MQCLVNVAHVDVHIISPTLKKEMQTNDFEMYEKASTSTYTIIYLSAEFVNERCIRILV